MKFARPCRETADFLSHGHQFGAVSPLQSLLPAKNLISWRPITFPWTKGIPRCTKNFIDCLGCSWPRVQSGSSYSMSPTQRVFSTTNKYCPTICISKLSAWGYLFLHNCLCPVVWSLLVTLRPRKVTYTKSLKNILWPKPLARNVQSGHYSYNFLLIVKPLRF